MKAMFDSPAYDFLARGSVFLLTFALVAMLGCVQPVSAYDLTIASAGGGSVMTPGEGTYTYYEGAVVELVAEAEEGYRFVRWAGDVSTIADVNAVTTTITINNRYSITAEFQRILQCGLTVTSTIGGCVTAPGEGIFSYDEGTVVNLVAIAANGYRFVNWSGDVATVGNVNAASTTITMVNDCHISANFGEGVVSFADPNLEAAVREAIAIPQGPIHPSDLQELTSLSASGKNISDLTGLEFVTNLTSLFLPSNQISDISPLASLTSLTELGLGDNQISDISPLASLTNLTWLNIGDNPISDISALAGLKSLTRLWLCNDLISDISPLVENEEFATGDYVCLKGNPLSSDSRNKYIPQLEARGVKVVKI
ncbi:MAG: InlB B-repeat-containing protein [Dehalococcoidia bacterium]